jgi:DNA invertase Pin-like site-specific DNA recombinase/DNA-binding transcriptional regulator YiaG
MLTPPTGPTKVTARHLKRDAYLYVRQSTLRQVVENTESTQRQYALRERAVALGWALEQVVVIDSDLGQSGASAADRAGFQRLVAEVGLGHVGIVLGLEVSRLARSSADWHHLLEICALTGTLILDEDGLYDPGHFNDRLVLGLKGTMSEAELHVLQARLQGGLLNKARRGDLKQPLPIGLVYTEANQVVLDPDQQVQQAVRLFFQTFARTGSAWKTVGVFRRQGLLFPRRVRTGARRGELTWGPLVHSIALNTLHNPRYAGAFFYGRTHSYRTADGRRHLDTLPREEWRALVRDAHAGYISWAEYEDNLRRLAENAQLHGKERRASPAREGPALVQGLVLCGRCGERMTVRYHHRRGQEVPQYVCQRAGIAHGQPLCQSVPGAALDAAIGELLVAMVTPLSLEVALAVQQELRSRVEETARLRHQQVEQARYQAELAQRRFLQVDPENRLVASVLEAEWNERLRVLAQAQEDVERHSSADRHVLSPDEHDALVALATDFPRLWRDPHTPDRERKRLVRLLLTDVTLLKEDQITAHVRFPGGATRTLRLPLAPPAWQARQTAPQVVQEIDRLAAEHTDGEIAALLNAQGLQSGEGKPFHRAMVTRIRVSYGLSSRFSRLRAQGLLTGAEMAARLGISLATLQDWQHLGRVQGVRYDEKGSCLYDPHQEPLPAKWTRRTAQPVTSDPSSVRSAV